MQSFNHISCKLNIGKIQKIKEDKIAKRSKKYAVSILLVVIVAAMVVAFTWQIAPAQGYVPFSYFSSKVEATIGPEKKDISYTPLDMSLLFNSDAYTSGQSYCWWGCIYPTNPGTIYTDPAYSSVPMDMRPAGTGNVWLSSGWDRTYSFPVSMTLDTNISNASNIWIAGLDGGWVYEGSPVEISYLLDGQRYSLSYNPNDWCYAGTDPKLNLWVDKGGSGSCGDIAVARIDLPKTGTLSQIIIEDKNGVGGVSIPVFAVTVRQASGVDDDELEVKGNFVLGQGSNGINPLNEVVIIKVGNLEKIIPAGFFQWFEDPRKTEKNEFRFEGIIDGVPVKMKIKPSRKSNYEFKFEAEGLNLCWITIPVEVILTIGDDLGKIEVVPEVEGLENWESGCSGLPIPPGIQTPVDKPRLRVFSCKN